MGTCRQAAARLGCLGGRPRSHQRHGPHRRGPIHGPRLHRPHCGEQVFGIALVSDFFLLVTGVAGSCFYCKRRRRSRCTLAAPVHPAVHCAPRPVASAATGPSARAVHTQRTTRGGAFATATCWPLTTLPTLSLTRHPSDLQAERRVRGCRREGQGNRTLLGQRQEVREEGQEGQEGRPRDTADQHAQRAVSPRSRATGMCAPGGK